MAQTNPDRGSHKICIYIKLKFVRTEIVTTVSHLTEKQTEN